MFHLLGTLIIGLVVGALAKLIMPGKDPGGFLMTMLLGIAGSFVGSWIGQTLGWYSSGERAGFLMSLGGALLILWIYRLINKPKTV